MLRLLENPERALPDAALEDVNDVRFVDEFLTREIEDQDPLSVLLVCRERAALRWGPRWLERVGFEVRVATSLSKARTILGSEESSVVVIEGGIRDRSGERAYLPLLERAKTMGVPVVVIASSLRDAKHALFAGAAEVAQRPHDWRVISRRAALVAVAHRASKGLDKAREAVAAARAEIASVLHRQELGAGTDSLTELPNRKIFLTLLEQTFSSPRPLDAMSAVLYVDLDRFGSVNESLGRDKADKLLALVAERLRRTFHGPELLAARTSGLVSATLARLGGDEFGLVISNVSSAEHLNPFFELLQEELNDSFELDDKQYYLSASFGVALYPHDGADAEEMLHHAELAMTQAKDLGGGMLRFYKPSLHTQARRQVAMSRDLSAALAGDELELHYQPIVDAKSGRTVAVEALLRWYHPEQGLIMPNEFIAVAEQASLMVPIGNWVIRTACAQLRTWLDAGLSPMRMAVNIARCQLLRPNLLEDIEDALLSADLDPGLLEIELSERGVLGHRAEIRELLAKIKSLGVRVALDDFGTGDSAIVYLRRLPVDSLKIDRSYISGMHDNEDNKIIASAMVAMAHELKLDVVAEGVETPEQLQNVTDWGCDEIQGFLFARPQPAADIPDIVAALEAEGLARLASSGE